MKTTEVIRIIVLMILLFGLRQASATAVASLYNGDHYQLNGQFLLQAADNPENFFLLPKKYRIKRNGKNFLLNHKVIEQSGQKFSIYNFKVILDEPSTREKLLSQVSLMNEKGINAQVVGMAPVCGIRLGVPGFSDSHQSASEGAANPNATFIQYSISSTAADRCNAPLDTSEFNIQYRVPFSLEPEVARNVTSEVGLTLPSVEVILPYKYQDSVVLDFEASSVIEELKGTLGLEGTIKVVSIGVNNSIEAMMNHLRQKGKIHRDCQNPDKSICDRFEKLAGEMLAKMVLQYLPLGTQGDTNPLVVADKDKSSGGLFKVAMATDIQSQIRDGKFHFDFTDVVYDMIHSQVQIDASRVPKTALDPEVQRLME